MNRSLLKYNLMKHISGVSSSGDMLDEQTRAYMERLLGYELKDVRIHETKHAGELARRLNADAFTIGKDIFASKSNLTAPDAENRGLLAHELTHFIQQSQPQRTTMNPVEVEFQGIPVIPGPGIIQQINNSGITDIHAPQRAPALRGSTGSNTSEAAMEAEAEYAEQTARTTEDDNSENESPDSINVHDIAERVYQMMQMELRIELDRTGRH